MISLADCWSLGLSGGWRGDLVSTHNVKQLLSLSPLECVVGFAGVIEVEVPLDPLAEFEIILILGFH